MGSAGKNTAEFFWRRDEWRKHPMLTNQFRHALPGFGIAVVAFGIYLFYLVIVGPWFFDYAGDGGRRLGRSNNYGTCPFFNVH
ncbi:hypothetical protein AHAS_Ahas19G0267900 [Arachis hypogaea]